MSSTDSPASATRQRTSSRDHASAVDSSVQAHLTQMVWEAGSRQMRDTFDAYGKIDLFRPYFDVEPRQVRNRLFQSLLPRKPSQMAVSADLYGPSMLILTMVALLLYSMKSSGYTIQDGTFIGTAMLTCFMWWLASSMCLYTACYVLSADAGLVHILSMMGYALFGHCLVLLLTSLFHPLHTHLFFYALLLMLAVPSSLRVALLLASKTRERSHKLLLGVAVLALHLGFLLYLHFGFHVVVEEIDEMFGDSPSLLGSSMTMLSKNGDVPLL